ncbi:TonB-dependent receptor [Oxalobacteraceae bacterium]|nr:TonB-dependent receptor [Oxalobacteraceae bacterium]
MRLHSIVCGMLLLAPLRPNAQETAPIGQVDNQALASAQVKVSASRAGQRQRETTATTIVNHEELQRYGDRNLADALRRQPGITIASSPGKSAEVRMRGLGAGYTQILLNGVAAPAGFTLDTLAPELIERVEILRSATAELGSQAIAGTINIILRKPARDGRRGIGASMESQSGRVAPAFKADLADRNGRLQYSLAATFARQHNAAPSLETEEAHDPQGKLTLLRQIRQSELVNDDKLALAPRLDWALDGGDTLVSQSLLQLRRIRHRHPSQENTPIGEPSEFPVNEGRYDASNSLLRSDLDWTHQMNQEGSFQLRTGLQRSWRSADFHFAGTDANGRPAGSHEVASGPAETSLTSRGTWRRGIAEGQALAAGWDASHARRSEYRHERQFDGKGMLHTTNDASYAATVRRLALFVQLEWDVSKRLSLYLGLRREALHTASDGSAIEAADSGVAVWSPSLQLLYKLNEKDQFRLALSRSYNPPKLVDLLPRRHTTDNNNGPTNADTQGNPALRPELAWGLDAAAEHYLADGGLLSASAYLRRIGDVTARRLFQQDGAWVETPYNNGSASVHGIELEAKLPLRTLPGLAHAPALEFSASLARNWSRVERVPGPDNRLERQHPFSASLGLDYRRRDSGFSSGASFQFQGAAPARISANLYETHGPRRQLDLYAAGQLAKGMQLRLSLANLLGQDVEESSRYTPDSNDATRRAASRTGNAAKLRISLELAL